MAMDKSALYTLLDVSPRLRLSATPVYPAVDSDYQMAIDTLNQLSTSLLPSEQLRRLILSYHLIKTSLGAQKVVMANMDEELPVIIFVLAHLQVDSLYAMLCLLDDYLSVDPVYEQDRRTMINYKVSL